jgi:hypothetical protein
MAGIGAEEELDVFRDVGVMLAGPREHPPSVAQGVKE